MSDRLKDLQRQRALAQEQIEWLDREIARETGASTPVPKSPATDDSFRGHRSALPLASPAQATAADADKIIEQYRSAKPIRSEVKQGCLVYFFVAFALVGVGLLILYVYHRLK